ncbi:hypothetical protein TNCV_48061 [Trichonephila clavipes]|nr:hypothetical protein TNCV_48061 [Trichonephila clavipes]
MECFEVDECSGRPQISRNAENIEMFAAAGHRFQSEDEIKSTSQAELEEMGTRNVLMAFTSDEHPHLKNERTACWIRIQPWDYSPVSNRMWQSDTETRSQTRSQSLPKHPQSLVKVESRVAGKRAVRYCAKAVARWSPSDRKNGSVATG